MVNVDSKIFNTNKTDYEKVSLIMGEQDVGVFDTINKQFPSIWSNYKKSKNQDWDEQEFNYSVCNEEFKTCPRAQYEAMILNLTYQWELDSIAANSIAPILAPFITSSELWAAWLKITEIEVLHAATYSEIIRYSFDNPREALEESLEVVETYQRMEKITQVMADSYKASHEYALGIRENDQDTYNHVFKFIVALYCLERIQFMASFAVTFAICDTGIFQPIGKAIQKIAQDELEVHVELDRIVLNHEMQTERGKVAWEQCKGEIQELIDEVVKSEFEWAEFLFSGGRELVGLNEDVLKQWVLFNAKDVYNTMKLKSPHKMPAKNPLKFMENWLDISKTQPAPQEQDIAQYRMNILSRDDDGVEFDVDF